MVFILTLPPIPLMLVPTGFGTLLFDLLRGLKRRCSSGDDAASLLVAAKGRSTHGKARFQGRAKKENGPVLELSSSAPGRPVPHKKIVFPFPLALSCVPRNGKPAKLLRITGRRKPNTATVARKYFLRISPFLFLAFKKIHLSFDRTRTEATNGPIGNS